MKFLQKLYCLSACTVLLCSAIPAEIFGQPQKVGIADAKKCMEQSNVGKKGQENLAFLQKQMEQSLEEKEKVLSDINNQLRDPDHLDSLSPEAEEKLKNKFWTLGQEFEKDRQQCSQMINQAHVSIVQQITEAIKKASKKVTIEQRLDTILNGEATFYYNPTLDVTEQIIKVMDENFKDEEKKH